MAISNLLGYLSKSAINMLMAGTMMVSITVAVITGVNNSDLKKEQIALIDSINHQDSLIMEEIDIIAACEESIKFKNGIIDSLKEVKTPKKSKTIKYVDKYKVLENDSTICLDHIPCFWGAKPRQDNPGNINYYYLKINGYLYNDVNLHLKGRLNYNPKYYYKNRPYKTNPKK